MFQFHVQSQNLAEAMRKISIAIPSASEKEENDGIKLAFYKNVKKINKSVGLLLAFDGKIQAVSSLVIEDVTADVEEIEVHVNGKKAEAAAYAFAAMDTVLEITIDKDVKISGAGSQITLQLCQQIVALKQTDSLLQEIEMNRDDFVSFVNFASSCFGMAKGSRGLHCVAVRIDAEKKNICAVSSNGTRCAYAESDKIVFKPIVKRESEPSPQTTENGDEKKPLTVVIEGKQLRNAVKNLTKNKVLIGIDKKKIRIKSGTDVVMILTQDISFPTDAVIQILDKCEKKGAWKTNLNKVFQALAIYEVTMETPQLEISPKGNSQICFHGKDELSSAAVVCAQEGEIQTVKVDEREWKSGLSVFDKEKDIIVETSSETFPIILRQHEDDPNRIAVMVLSD